MHSNSDNFKFAPYHDANGVSNELFKSLRSKYQEHLKKSMKGSDCIFDSVQLLYYKCHKVNFEHGGSYIDSLDWIKKAPINLKNDDVDKCFQYAGTVILNSVKNIKIFSCVFLTWIIFTDVRLEGTIGTVNKNMFDRKYNK